MSRLVGLIFAALLVAPPAGSTQAIHSFDPYGCTDGIVHAPRGPFAVWVFCEDALATHLGVVYAGHMMNPVEGGWSISDRFWQQAEWASDAQSFAWSVSGERLFVSTGAVYGSSSLYQLDLRARKARRLSGPYPNRSVELIAVRPGLAGRVNLRETAGFCI